MVEIKKPEGYSSEFWEKQKTELAAEIETIERHREEARRFVADQLARDAHIFVMDLGGVQDPRKGGDEELSRRAKEFQFAGSDRTTYGSAIRDFMGFEKGDDRVKIWEAFRNQEIDLSSLPYPDVWVTTGGAYMPSELDPGNETENTPWLKRVVEVMNKLKQARVPGLAICLGHQLFQRSEGATLGKVGGGTREFGTPDLYPDEAGLGKQIQLLQGFWDDGGSTPMSASHSEGIITPSSKDNIQVVAWNDYFPHQGYAHPLREGQGVLEADQDDELVVSLQNHPDIVAHWLHVIKIIRGDAMEQEGLDPKEILLRNTAEARRIWMNLLELTARRQRKRLGATREI